MTTIRYADMFLKAYGERSANALLVSKRKLVPVISRA